MTIIFSWLNPPSPQKWMEWIYVLKPALWPLLALAICGALIGTYLLLKSKRSTNRQQILTQSWQQLLIPWSGLILAQLSYGPICFAAWWCTRGSRHSESQIAHIWEQCLQPIERFPSISGAWIPLCAITAVIWFFLAIHTTALCVMRKQLACALSRTSTIQTSWQTKAKTVLKQTLFYDLSRTALIVLIVFWFAEDPWRLRYSAISTAVATCLFAALWTAISFLKTAHLVTAIWCPDNHLPKRFFRSLCDNTTTLIVWIAQLLFPVFCTILMVMVVWAHYDIGTWALIGIIPLNAWLHIFVLRTWANALGFHPSYADWVQPSLCANTCKKCFYPRTGLAKDSPCPECGEPPVAQINL